MCQILQSDRDEPELFEVKAVIKLSEAYETELPYGRWDVTNNRPHM